MMSDQLLIANRQNLSFKGWLIQHLGKKNIYDIIFRCQKNIFFSKNTIISPILIK